VRARWITLNTTVVATVTAAACHRAKPIPAPAAQLQGTNVDSVARANARRDSIARAEEAQRLAADRANAARSADEASAAVARARASLTATIHFEFDQAAILDADRPVLDQKVQILKANPELRVRIAGNTDERGSDEYNLALAMRRAAIAKRYLAERGIDGTRLEVISYGEERPICQDQDESCWARNRRAEFSQRPLESAHQLDFRCQRIFRAGNYRYRTGGKAGR